MTSFYEELYGKSKYNKKEGDKSYMEGIDFPKITNIMRMNLEVQISQKEIREAVFALKKGKTPGNDGIPAEFYQKFYHKLETFLTELYLEIVDAGIFHLSARRGVITLIEKQDRDPRLLKSWRPISLLNSDLKVYSKIIALRLQSVISHIIHKTQVGFIKGRFIGENIVRLLNIIDYCENNKKSAILISFDFEKAFDKVSWKSMYTALELFNFGPYFVGLIKTLYNKPLSCIINNGWTGNYFELHRSTRQGDPASALIFAIVVELLGIKIRLRADIKGINLGNYEVKAAQYADDLWTVLEPGEENINNLLKELAAFESFAGLNINYEKSVATVLGPLRDTDPKYYTMKQMSWTKKEIRILGVDIHPNVEQMINVNYMKLFKELEKIIEKWEHRKLTVMGRIVLVNALIAAKFAYRFMVLPSPDKLFFKLCKQRILEFIWGGKTPKIKYSKIIQDYSKGGLKLVDLETKNSALKCKWVKHLQDNPQCNEWFFMNKRVKDNRIWQCNLNEDDAIKMKGKGCDFPGEVLRAWAKFNFETPTEPIEIMNQMVWGNTFIKRGGAVILSEDCIDANMDMLYLWISVEEKRFLTNIEIFENTGTSMNDMTLNAVKTAIPNTWKQVLLHECREEWQDQYVTNFEKLGAAKKVVTGIYKTMIEKQLVADGCSKAWEIELGIRIEIEEWENLFPNIFSYTNNVTLRYFQYKILNRILVTNVKVNKWNKNISENCNLCFSAPETVIHLLVECPQVQSLWTLLQRWIKYFMGMEVEFTKELIILNNYKGGRKKLINTLILILKRYIYIKKCLGHEATFQGFISEVYHIRKIEKLTAYEKNKMKIFEKKWKDFY